MGYNLFAEKRDILGVISHLLYKPFPKFLGHPSNYVPCVDYTLGVFPLKQDASDQ